MGSSSGAIRGTPIQMSTKTSGRMNKLPPVLQPRGPRTSGIPQTPTLGQHSSLNLGFVSFLCSSFSQGQRCKMVPNVEPGHGSQARQAGEICPRASHQSSANMAFPKETTLQAKRRGQKRASVSRAFWWSGCPHWKIVCPHGPHDEGTLALSDLVLCVHSLPLVGKSPDFD